jgi:signal transduction histidine kinase
VHDQLGGLVVQLRLTYGAWQQAATPSGDTAPGAAFGALLAELSGTLRRLSFALAPPDWHDDLSSALESVAAELRLRGSLSVRLDVTALQCLAAPVLPAVARRVVSRVVRELGMNVLKHAGASCVRIHADVVNRQLRIDVQDDGCGPPAVVASVGLGLRSARAQLRALGGSLALVPGPGGGSHATLTLPVEACWLDLEPRAELSAGGRP